MHMHTQREQNLTVITLIVHHFKHLECVFYLSSVNAIGYKTTRC